MRKPGSQNEELRKALLVYRETLRRWLWLISRIAEDPTTHAAKVERSVRRGKTWNYRA